MERVVAKKFNLYFNFLLLKIHFLIVYRIIHFYCSIIKKALYVQIYQRKMVLFGHAFNPPIIELKTLKEIIGR